VTTLRPTDCASAPKRITSLDRVRRVIGDRI
jgi:hypothetical protein